jgi:ABC-type transport system substrate-binding protein
MSYNRLLSPRFLIFVPLLLVLMIAVACGEDATATPRPTATAQPTATAVPPTLTPMPTATLAPSFTTSSVDQLVLATSPWLHDSILPWKVCCMSANLWPVFEALITQDPETGFYVAGLATEWSIGADLRSWNFKLREGIPFHQEWGEVTAKDIRHAFEMTTLDESLASNAGLFRDMVGDAENVEIVDDYNVVFHLTKPGPDLEYDFSGKAGTLMLYSKDQWDAGGVDGLLRDMTAGTGSWRLADWESVNFTLLERVEDHWRKTPEFKEQKVLISQEQATKLAMLLTGEAHMSDLTKDLQEDALAAGMELVVGNFPSGHPYMFYMGGLYSQTPDKYDESNPLTNVKVREALNRAIDRQELIDTIFYGRASMATHHGYQPSYQGWDDSWTERFGGMYGFDPVRARELLTEAGYPDGFELEVYDYAWGGAPEINQLAEAVGQYLTNIGIDVKILSTEYQEARQNILGKTLGVRIGPWAPWSARPTAPITYMLHDSEGAFGIYEDEFIDGKFDELDASTDYDARSAILREVGERLFTQYAEIPLVYTFFEVVVDPNVIGNYPLSGNFTGSWTETEYITAAK